MNLEEQNIEQETNLWKIKIESYISAACIFCMFFFSYALIVTIILQIHIIYMLAQDSKTPALFEWYLAALFANLAYLVGLYFVHPSNPTSLFYIGLFVIIASAPLLFKCAMRFTKELIIQAKNRIFWLIVAFVVVEFYAGFMWVVSTLWHWWKLDFRGFDDKAILVVAISAFIITPIFILNIFLTDNFPAKNGESSESNATSDENTANLES